MAQQSSGPSPNIGSTMIVDPDDSLSGAPRVGHKKSRNGCAQCKRRHVKCNEEKPCSNCVRHGVACSLAGGPNVSRDDNRPRRSPGESSSLTRTDSLTDSSDVLSPEAEYRGASPLRRLTQTLERRRSDLLEHAWMMDLELMHHVDRHAQAFLDEADWASMWQEDMPQLAFSSPYVMHIILGIAALHLASIKPLRATELRQSAVSHLDKALSSFRQDDSPTSAENANQRFCFSFMVCLFAYATPSTVSPIDALCEIFALIRGVETVAAETFIWVAGGPFAPLMNRSLHEVMRLASNNDVNIPQGMGLGIDHLDYMLASEPLLPDESQVLLTILQDLKTVYANVLSAGSSTGVALVICWPKADCHQYSIMLRNRVPQALVILAHYCVILNLLNHKWYMRGWPAQVLQVIMAELNDSWKSWIQWPIKVILMDTSLSSSVAMSPYDGSRMLF